MNYLIITFPNHEVYTYLKLIVDNFSMLHGTWTSTSLARENARRARCVRSRIRDPCRKVRYSGEFGSLKHLKTGSRPSEAWCEMHKKLRFSGEFGSLNLTGGSAARRAPASSRTVALGPRRFNYREFGSLRSLTKSRSAMLPSYNPGTENTLFAPRSLVLQP